jgi:alginate O-acetyltransferase complex protein AlgI
MLFNSFDYFFFLPIVFFLYWFVGTQHRIAQNILILGASYIFYGWWSWKFLGLLVLSTVLDYFYGFGVNSSNIKRKRMFLVLSVINNLGILAIFKYFNFFSEQLSGAFLTLGIQVSPIYLDILLPVGISFYTFHGMSYVFDIYRDRIKPVTNIIDYSVFVSFFPLLVAGPIERANHLLPQIQSPRKFRYEDGVLGMRLIVWGLFKKVVVADNAAYFANLIFNNYEDYNSLALFIGAIMFSIQIYGDFSGYSDMALGSARLLGFRLLINFRFPYFSRDLAEFWKRWHISLSSWFRDYLFIPLGGSKKGKLVTVRNTFIVFIVSGFWHGASWNFIGWGLFHAVGFLPLLLLNRTKFNTGSYIGTGKVLPSLSEFSSMLITYVYVLFGWILFRLEDFNCVQYVFRSIFSLNILSLPNLSFTNAELLRFLHLGMTSTILFLCEWFSRSTDSSVHFMDGIPNRFLRFIFYIFVVLVIWYMKGDSVEFIYFAF